jgi:hypothetical protein
VLELGCRANGQELLAVKNQLATKCGTGSQTWTGPYGTVWTGVVWPRMGPVMGCCEHGYELLGSIQGGEFCE